MNFGMTPMCSFEEKISHYEISSLLGKGGFAVVYAARRKRDNLPVACKMIDRKKLEQETVHHHQTDRYGLSEQRQTSMIDRLNAEIMIHHQVKHPNIVELMNCFYDDKHVYLILEYCSRGDLEHYLKEKKTLNEHETQGIVKQVVHGLVYLHHHGIIHRDIKLSNLLLTENMEVKIADFGLAKSLKLAGEQNNETMCGTPNYISPEIASRAPHSFATDVWSLGILTATLLTGRPPFDTDTVHETLSKVTQEIYELPTHFSEEAQDLVNNTLKKTAELRPNIIEIRDHPFFRKDFQPTPHSSYNETNSYQKLSLLGPNTTVDRSIDSGLGETMGRQRSTLGTTSTSTSVASGTYSARHYSSDRISSPQSSHQSEPFHKSNTARSKTPHDRYVAYPVSTSTPSQNHIQQPIYAGQSPSFDAYYKRAHWSTHIAGNTNDYRPDSATSSVRSQDSGVPQSDAKTSHDFSAKSEGGSSTLSAHNGTNSHLTNIYPSNMTRHRMMTSYSNNHLTPSPVPPKTPVLDASAEQIREKLQPLNTQRLKMLRQATKSFIMSIMDSGEVVLESIRNKGNKRRVVDVFRVSGDGLHIITYSPNSRHALIAADHPPPIPRDRAAYHEYHFDELPAEYWKKYQYAHKFVTLVRSRISKIILYTPDAKCLLMETGIDFEATFLCGVKITICRENFKSEDPLKIKIINHKDKSESLIDFDRIAASNRSAVEHFSPEIRQMLDQTLLFYKFCLAKEKLLEECQKQFPSIQMFPVQFGKKHAQADSNRPATPCSIGRHAGNQFGGSSSTVNELSLAPPPPPTVYSTNTLTLRREFGSETDIRTNKPSSTPTVMSASVHGQVQSINFSSNTRGVDSQYSGMQMTTNTHPTRPHSVHPSSSHNTETLSYAALSNRQPMNNHYTSTTSLNSTASGGTTTTTLTTANDNQSIRTAPLTRKAIFQHSQGTYRVTFSDNSAMIIRADCTDGQMFIDSQGKKYLFDRRQPEQPEPIQERLALMYQDDQELRNSNMA